MTHDDPIAEDHGKFSRHLRAIAPRHPTHTEWPSPTLPLTLAEVADRR
ncbi:MAG: hypothetical protein KDB35_23670 [Acidimicrobiales bacterium]|nr:hypothetical protein [Acidimicrobiales bacterium]